MTLLYQDGSGSDTAERETFISYGERKQLALFKNDAAKFPLLTREQEILLARQARQGDINSRNRLIECNLRFVLMVAGRYFHPSAPLMDIVSEGCMGLLFAVDRIEPDRGSRVITYAYWWIRAKILRFLVERRKHTHNSLDDAAYEDEGATLVDLLESTESLPDAVAFDDQVRDLLSTLNERERKILELHYRRDKSYEEIGALVGLTRERVRQIEMKALFKLRWVMNEMYKAKARESSNG